jgi:hypothetical protein
MEQKTKYKIFGGIMVLGFSSIVGSTLYSIHQEKQFWAQEPTNLKGTVIKETYVEPEEGGVLQDGRESQYRLSLPGDSVEDVIKGPIIVRVEDSYINGEEVTKEDVGAWIQEDTCVNIQAREVSNGIYKALAHEVKPCNSLDDKL